MALFIVYGSLFPFAFHPHADAGGPVAYLLSTWREWDSRVDLLSNILLYIPFGFFAFHSLQMRRYSVLTWFGVILLGSTLSACMELAQYFDEGRVTSMGDVYANAIGTAIGATAAWLTGAGMAWPFAQELARCRQEALLLVLFLGYRLYPYVPSPTRQQAALAVRSLMNHPVPTMSDLVRFTIIWLLITALVDRIYGTRRWVYLFPMLAAAEFAGRVVIFDATATVADLAGAGLAFVAWGGLLRWLPGRFAILSALFACLLAFLRLQPFIFSQMARVSFGWIPFWSMMNGSVSVAIQALFEKSYQYGGLIWLLGRAGAPLPASTAATAILLFGTSLLEVFLPDRSAEITDAVIALMMGGLFMLIGDRPVVGRPDSGSVEP
jgi:VanZ family protein